MGERADSRLPSFLGVDAGYAHGFEPGVACADPNSVHPQKRNCEIKARPAGPGSASLR